MWHASRNSNNRTISHYRSTDALLGTSSDDFLIQSSENLAGPLTVTVSSDTEIKCHSSVCIDDSECPDQLLDSTGGFSHSNSTTNLLSNLDTVFSIQLGESYAPKPPSNNVKRFSTHKEAVTIEQMEFTADAQLIQVTDKNDNHSMNYNMLHEKNLFQRHEKMHNVGVECSQLAADVQKRQSKSRSPIHYRFSAGDADKLEKGIKHIPSTRSLKDN